jgi:hypothetical protein
MSNLDCATCDECKRSVHIKCIPKAHAEYFPSLLDNEWDEDFVFQCTTCFPLMLQSETEMTDSQSSGFEFGFHSK